MTMELGLIGEADGLSSDTWFCNRGKFWGTVAQLLNCARCGRRETKRHDEPRHFCRTPRMHLLCEECFDLLPETPAQTSGSEPL